MVLKALMAMLILAALSAEESKPIYIATVSILNSVRP